MDNSKSIIPADFSAKTQAPINSNLSKLAQRPKKSIPLPKNVRKNGFDYVRHAKGDKTYIYKQWISPIHCAFEVFYIKVRPERLLRGKLIEAKETYPHNEAFGKWAWSFYDKEKAMEIQSQLENRIDFNK